MLSATYTLTDIKARLIKDFAFYGFADDTEFDDSLTLSVEDSRLLNLIPAIGEQQYSTIATLDKVGLTTEQIYIYLAEIHFAMSQFVKMIDGSKVQSVEGTGHSHSVGDVSESITGGTKGSGRAAAAGWYYRKATNYLVLAGYNTLQLARGGTPV